MPLEYLNLSGSAEFPRVFGPINLIVASLSDDHSATMRMGFQQSNVLPKNPSDEVMLNGAIVKRTTPAPSARVGEEAAAWKIKPKEEHQLKIRPNFEGADEKQPKSVLTAVIQSLLTTEDYNRGLARPFEIEIGKGTAFSEDVALMEPYEYSDSRSNSLKKWNIFHVGG